jgi:hypothetical protein
MPKASAGSANMCGRHERGDALLAVLLLLEVGTGGGEAVVEVWMIVHSEGGN